MIEKLIEEMQELDRQVDELDDILKPMRHLRQRLEDEYLLEAAAMRDERGAMLYRSLKERETYARLKAEDDPKWVSISEQYETLAHERSKLRDRFYDKLREFRILAGSEGLPGTY